VSSLRWLFYVTLLLVVGFTFSSTRDFGLLTALPWIVAAWIGWGLGVAWVRARGHRWR
jgi:hypothetical protein